MWAFPHSRLMLRSSSNQPDRYILGILGDGDSYCLAPTAREKKHPPPRSFVFLGVAPIQGLDNGLAG